MRYKNSLCETIYQSVIDLHRSGVHPMSIAKLCEYDRICIDWRHYGVHIRAFDRFTRFEPVQSKKKAPKVQKSTI
jgi:hypothetical protein